MNLMGAITLRPKMWRYWRDDMNREILFRGKRMDSGEWVYGCYFQMIVDGTVSILEMREHPTTLPFDFLIRESLIAVGPETVCQYTGLTDRNGRRFEGDIFQASDGEYFQRYIITWSEDLLGWYAECVGDPDGTLPLSEFRVGDIEVIGNIFDNPELLEGGAE